MTNEQIKKAAQNYANQNFIEAVVREHPRQEAKEAYARAYADGAHFALASQWVSVDEQLPGYDDDVLVFVPAELTFGIPDRYTVAYYNGKDWHTTTDGELIHPDFWSPIPKLNPEKE